MVKDVVRIKAELCLDAFGNRETLRESHVGEEATRAAQGIAAEVADLATSGQSKRAARWPSQCARIGGRSDPGIRERWNRGEPKEVSTNVSARSRIERARSLIGAAGSGIRDLAALGDARCPRETATVVQSVAHLPAADQEIRGAADPAEELLAATDGQFVHGVSHECVIAVEVVGTISDARINREVIVIVIVGMRVGVMSDELEAVAEAPYQYSVAVRRSRVAFRPSAR